MEGSRGTLASMHEVQPGLQISRPLELLIFINCVLESILEAFYITFEICKIGV